MALGAATLAFIVSLGADFGGEKIIDVTYTDGSTSSIEAGQGVHLAGGLVYRPAADVGTFSQMEIQTTLGGKWASTKEAKNGGITWAHYPLEALVFWHPQEANYRFGGGATAQFGNKLSGSGVAGELNVAVDNAVGAIIQGDYYFGEMKAALIGLRYTNIKYTANGASIEGSSFGFLLSYQWPSFL